MFNVSIQAIYAKIEINALGQDYKKNFQKFDDLISIYIFNYPRVRKILKKAQINEQSQASNFNNIDIRSSSGMKIIGI